MPSTPRNRRVPPKGNPGNGPDQSATTVVQSAQIPWTTLIVTTGITTISGYLFLEAIRATHRWFKAKREIPGLTTQNPEHTLAAGPPGTLPTGTFQLPMPDGAQPSPVAGPSHLGFAHPHYPGQRQQQPQNPLGQLQHQMVQAQRATDARLRRIEQMIAGAGAANQPGMDYGQTG